MDHDKTKNENILLLADILPAEASRRNIFFSFKNAKTWYSF